MYACVMHFVTRIKGKGIDKFKYREEQKKQKAKGNRFKSLP